MKVSTATITLVIAIGLGAIPVVAQSHGGGHATADVHGNAASSHEQPHHGLFSHSPSKTISSQLNEPSHAKLDSRLEKLVGAQNLSELQASSAGFKNLGQFVASAHVYNNLGLAQKNVSWTQFSATSQKMGLGKAVHAYAPSVNSKQEVKRASDQAQADITAG